MRVGRFFICITVLIIITSLIPTVQASPEVIIYEIETVAKPKVQRLGAPIELTCDIGFGGACCYTVYANEMEAEIVLPENITLFESEKIKNVTSPGQAQGRIAVNPGGSLTWMRPAWKIQGKEYGDYEIIIRIRGVNEGGTRLNETVNITITIARGASVSIPVLPNHPDIHDDTVIVAEVSSIESQVAAVTLYHSRDQKTWENTTMLNTEGDVWTGTIPAQNSETTIYYYMQSITEEGETFTTEVYSLEVKDMDRIGITAAFLTYGTLAVFVSGMGILLYSETRRRSSKNIAGMTILGAALRLSAMRGLDDISDTQTQLRRRRKLVTIGLTAVIIAMLVTAIVTGQLQDVISNTTNLKGS